MPELPEVETVRIGLQHLLPGRQVAKADFDWTKSFPNSATDVQKFLIGSTVQEVRRRAKVLLIDLNTGYTLVVHLKMTGQLVFLQKTSKLKVKGQKSKVENPDFSTKELSLIKSNEVRFGAGHPNDSLVGELPDRSTRVTLTFADGSHLFFNDQRKFGWMRLLPTVEVPNIDFMKKVGPEPLEADFTPNVFAERLQRRKNSTIKAALLDQTVVAGIGNIYADESLWGAKIHPETRVKNIGHKQLNTLFDQIQYILTLAIEKGGSSDKNYVNAEGKRGSYLSFARVFRREGQPCQDCGTTIIKTRVAGRGTHLCPSCQSTA